MPSAETIVTEFFDLYAAAFKELAPLEIASFWRAPTLAIGGAGYINACNTQDALNQAFRTAVGDLRKIGVANASYKANSIHAWRDDLIEVDTNWKLANEAGTTVKTLHNIYTIRCVSDEWKISTVFLLD